VYADLPGEAEPRAYAVMAVNSPILAAEIGEAVMAGAAPDVQFAVVWSHVPEHDEIWAVAKTTRPDFSLARVVPFIAGASRGVASGGFTVAGSDVGRALHFAARPAPASRRGPPRKTS
jgi:hypothetical protein